MKRQDAPGSLELVRGFINTRDLEKGVDAVATPDALRSWLVDRGLMEATAPVAATAWQRALDVREALRALARANSGTAIAPAIAPGVVPGVVQILDELARDAEVRLRFRQGGGQVLAPREDGGALPALGRVLAIAGQAAMNGTWQRLKACAAEDCLWAFYDHAKNRSGLWCQMAECGNRAKARTYRARHSMEVEIN